MDFAPELLLAPAPAPTRELPAALAGPGGTQGGEFAALMQELSRVAPAQALQALSSGDAATTTDGPGRAADRAAVATHPAAPPATLIDEPAIAGLPTAMAGDAAPLPDTAEPPAPAPRGAPTPAPGQGHPPTSRALQARPPETVASASPLTLEGVRTDPAAGPTPPQGPPPSLTDDLPSERPSPEPGAMPQLPAASGLGAAPAGPMEAEAPSVPGGAAPVEAPPRVAAAAAGDDATQVLAKDAGRGGIAPGAAGPMPTRAMRMREPAGGNTLPGPDQPAPGVDSQHERAVASAGRPVGEPAAQGPSATQPSAPGGSIPAQMDAAPAQPAGGPQGPAIAGAAQGQAPPTQLFTTWMSHVPFEAAPERLGAPAPIDQLTLQLSRALDEGRTEIRIRLQPEELGQVDIKLEFKELQLTVKVSAERPETLELLQRDARALSRAFREAGVEVAEGGLTFTSGGRSGTGSPPHEQRGLDLARLLPDDARLLAPDPALMPIQGVVSLRDGRLDIRA